MGLEQYRAADGGQPAVTKVRKIMLILVIIVIILCLEANFL
jgi:hypothetical protein